ncbi:MAG TPA: SemiSWEET family transporter [Candidatus Thermoplasmatota archaeon]|nr:SemiSWEET family transporter [Candidatus Thermoplasmatota archaeon]
MTADLFTWLGLAAGTITSIGFLPQIIKGYTTKHLEDVSYWMPLVIAAGMMLWLFYGVLRNDIAIILANAFGVGCNIVLVLLKKWYARPKGDTE